MFDPGSVTSSSDRQEEDRCTHPARKEAQREEGVCDCQREKRREVIREIMASLTYGNDVRVCLRHTARLTCRQRAKIVSPLQRNSN